jgi:hypothetical protein
MYGICVHQLLRDWLCPSNTGKIDSDDFIETHQRTPGVIKGPGIWGHVFDDLVCLIK